MYMAGHQSCGGSSMLSNLGWLLLSLLLSFVTATTANAAAGQGEGRGARDAEARLAHRPLN